MQTPFPDIVATAITYLSEVDPVMRATIERVGPCTLEPDPDIFTALVDAIISQQISVRAADAIMARVRAALPEGKVTPEALLPFGRDRSPRVFDQHQPKELREGGVGHLKRELLEEDFDFGIQFRRAFRFAQIVDNNP